MQEVFTRVWRHAGSFDPDKASFRTWLYGIARNAIIDLKRRQSVRPALAAHPVDEEQGATDDSFERALLRWQVGAALERLTPSTGRSSGSPTSRASRCARSPSAPASRSAPSRAARRTPCAGSGSRSRRWGWSRERRLQRVPHPARRLRAARARAGRGRDRAPSPVRVLCVRVRARRADGDPVRARRRRCRRDARRAAAGRARGGRARPLRPRAPRHPRLPRAASLSGARAPVRAAAPLPAALAGPRPPPRSPRLLVLPGSSGTKATAPTPYPGHACDARLVCPHRAPPALAPGYERGAFFQGTPTCALWVRADLR